MRQEVLNQKIYEWLKSSLGTSNIIDIVFDSNFVLGNKINGTIDGNSIVEIEFIENHSKTLNKLANAISYLPTILKAEVIGARTIRLTAVADGHTIDVDSIVVTDGLTQPTFIQNSIQNGKELDVILEDQAEYKPNYPYASFRINNIEQIGYDDFNDLNTVTGVAKYKGDRRATIAVQYFGTNAIQEIHRAYISLNSERVLNIFRSEFFYFENKNSIQNLSDLLESNYEERAFFDFYVKYADIDEAHVGVIESAQGVGEFNEAGDDFVENNFSSEVTNV